MERISVVLVALLAVIGKGSVVPSSTGNVPFLVEGEVHTISGESGTFSYPKPGTKGPGGTAHFQLQINQSSVFTVQRIKIEPSDTVIRMFNSANSVLQNELRISTDSLEPQHYLINSDVFLTMWSRVFYFEPAFTFSWGPILNTEAVIPQSASVLSASSPSASLGPKKVYTLSGEKGSFSYPVGGGYYDSQEYVYMQLEINQPSIFTIQNIDTDAPYDVLRIFNSASPDLKIPIEVSGFSITPRHFQVDSDVFLLFETGKLVSPHIGFDLAWEPINSISQK